MPTRLYYRKEKTKFQSIMTQEIELTASQTELVVKVKNFLRSDARVFLLIGPAGSGKTTGIKYAIQEQLAKKADWNGLPTVAGIALAHKAKNVLRKSIPFVYSFASAYGYKEQINEETGERTFAPATFFKEEPVGHCPVPIFVHDEVSMYSQQMIDIMLAETPMSSKIILMGDSAQLPPVNPKSEKGIISDPDADSPVFDLVTDERYRHELTEIVRQQADNPILQLATEIRKEIKGNKDVNKIVSMIMNPKMHNGVGWDIWTEDKCIDEIVGNKDFINNKVITYRKKYVAEYNEKIRNIVFENPTATLIENDIIFLTNNFMSKEPEFVLHNADEYIVTRVSKADIKTSQGIVESYFAFIPNDKFGFPVYVLTPTEDKGMKQYRSIVKKLKDAAEVNRSMWRVYYRFADTFTEFTMGFAINAYRSQGSTYQNVYFDLMDVLSLNVLSPKRMLQTIYTVITRASEKVIFIQPDPNKKY